jgi:hypothetical protein
VPVVLSSETTIEEKMKLSEKEILEINDELDAGFKGVTETLGKLNSKTDAQLEKLLVIACEAIIANKADIVKMIRMYHIQIELILGAMLSMMKVMVPAILMLQEDTERVLKGIKRSAVNLFIHKALED